MEFLRTRAIASKIDDIILDAKEQIYIISPYWDPTEETKKALQTAANRDDVELHLVYGKSRDLKDEVYEFIQELDCTSYFIQDLHAKCYLNESEAVLCSMNLYAYSEAHNFEMGISFTRDEDERAFEKLKTHILDMLNSAEGFDLSAGLAPRSPPKKRSSARRRSPPPTRLCIGCWDLIPKIEGRPICDDCFDSFRNETMVDDGVWDNVSDALTEDEDRTREFGQMLLDAGESLRCIVCATKIPARLDHPRCRRCYRAQKQCVTEPEEDWCCGEQPGYCINCRDSIDLNLQKPLCRKCYYKARKGICHYCHYCGDRSKTQLNAPLCEDCV